MKIMKENQEITFLISKFHLKISQLLLIHKFVKNIFFITVEFFFLGDKRRMLISTVDR